MSAQERIGRLEALLERIRANASAPRAVSMMTAMPTVPPSAEAREKMRSESSEFEAPVPPPAPPSPPPPPAVEPPLESRARLVSEPPMELDEEEVEVLDERHVVADVEVAAAAPPPVPERIEEPPPSSRRPIAEPAESPQEAQLAVAQPPLTPPPESGKQVAAEALSFDDDFTGVRESAARLQKAAAEPSIPLEALRQPSPPPPPHELEAEIPRAQPETVLAPQVARGEETRPPPAPPVHEITRPTTPVAASDVANLVGAAPTFSPKTFGELLEASLAL